ncbi:hypothetical protein IKQ26_04985 [bacterium]|nr:hypothetical protein [bacterium]
MSFLDKLKEKYRDFLMKQYVKNAKKQGLAGGSYVGSSSKAIVSDGATMRLDSKTENLKQLIKDSAKKELVKYLQNPEELLKDLRQGGVTIHQTKYSKVILSNIDEEEGFIVGQEGFYAFKLNMLLASFALQPFSFSFKTKPMFILSDEKFDIFLFAEHFYKFLAYKHKLSGLDFRSQKKCSRINKYAPDSTSVYEKMPLNDLLALKEAVARNIEAVTFAAEFTKEFKTSKKAFDNMKNDGTSI